MPFDFLPAIIATVVGTSTERLANHSVLQLDASSVMEQDGIA